MAYLRAKISWNSLYQNPLIRALSKFIRSNFFLILITLVYLSYLAKYRNRIFIDAENKNLHSHAYLKRTD